ncbi:MULTISPECIES: BspA family leucine-rich repeat surface protein [unclassified Helicobacter]|uniref:BspA family leucine-rich repeat surface protein n=1 Tax=unclassified Helicobacter TaxID=2593540 RepID=UPI000A729E1C|nr:MULTISPECIES: BspA family leucine-rich repeat surface protein [unclassified Helicobacter]
MTMQNLKIPNLKNLAFIGIAAFSLNICLANTNPLTDKSKHKYHPKNRDELVKLLNDECIKLDTIDTSKIKDMSFLFVNVSSDDCDELAEASKIFTPHLAPYIKNCKNSAGAREDFDGIETWDVSNVKDMTGMFGGADSFNQPLNSWDVGKVTDMSCMFCFTESFNQPLDKWNVSKVKNMIGMFFGAASFDQPLNSWNVGKVEDMSLMFCYAESFNQPLDKWNVSKVKNMKGIFSRAASFNQPLDKWDVSNVVDMDYMFVEAESFNQNLNSWKINKGAHAEGMFNESPLESNPPKWYKE